MSEEAYTPAQFVRSLILRGYAPKASAEEYVKLFPKEIYFESDLEEAYRYYENRSRPQDVYKEIKRPQTRSDMAFFEYRLAKKLNWITREIIYQTHKLK